jgi:DNA-binding transcriptional MerR regulator
VTYILIGLMPAIPKRFFLPLVLYNSLAALAAVPLSIYYYPQVARMSWVMSLLQVLIGLAVLYRLQGGLSFNWPLVPEERLASGGFSLRNLFVFLALNLFLLLPGTVLYLLVCASLAADHFTDGFLALHHNRLSVRTRTYVRGDGKTIRLIPMMHIGEAEFYRHVSQVVPTNAVVLLEGVTDRRHLLHNKLSYNRMAQSLGLAEQREDFNPGRGNVRLADVDVEQFSKTTLELLNIIIQWHARGLTWENLQALFQNSESPEATDQLWKDLLTNRNEHLLHEIQEELGQSQFLVVPWGAAHMPGVAKGIQKAGFHPAETQEFDVVHFWAVWKQVLGPSDTTGGGRFHSATNAAPKVQADFGTKFRTKFQ